MDGGATAITAPGPGPTPTPLSPPCWQWFRNCRPRCRRPRSARIFRTTATSSDGRRHAPEFAFPSPDISVSASAGSKASRSISSARCLASTCGGRRSNCRDWDAWDWAFDEFWPDPVWSHLPDGLETRPPQGRSSWVRKIIPTFSMVTVFVVAALVVLALITQAGVFFLQRAYPAQGKLIEVS